MKTASLLLGILAAQPWRLEAVDENGALRAGSGVRSAGIGAFSALDDDGTGISWNPAGSVQLEDPELAIAIGAYARRAGSAGNPTENSTAAALDHLSFAVPVNFAGFQQSFGVFFQRQFDFGRSVRYALSDDESVTNTAIDQTGSYSSLGLSYAIELLPGIGVGATMNDWRDSWTHASHYRRRLTFQIDDSFFDTHLTTEYDLRTRVTSGVSVVLGSWARVHPDLALALVYRPGFTLGVSTDEAIREHDADGPTANDGQRQSQRAQWHYPPSATFGIALSATDNDTLVMDVTWTRWRQFWLESAGTRISPVSPGIGNDQFRDGFAASLGYERVVLLDEATLAVRVGASYEELPGLKTAPTVDTGGSQLEPTMDRIFGGSFGLSLITRSLTYDLAVQARHGEHVGTNQDTSIDKTASVSMVTLEAGITVLLGQ